MIDSEISKNHSLLTRSGATVLVGTSEYPIVCRTKFGEQYRALRPERPQQLPTYIYWDNTLNSDQQEVALEGIDELYTFLNLDQSKVSCYGDWRSDSYIDNINHLTPHESIQWAVRDKYDYQRKQIDGDNFVKNMFADPYQIERPHWKIIFTNHNIKTSTANSTLGVTTPDLGTLISFASFPGYERIAEGREVIKTEIFHELGHVLGLPSMKRIVYDLDNSSGYHCKSYGCSMRQGGIVPTDWIKLTEQRLRRNEGPYCRCCMDDFKK